MQQSCFFFLSGICLLFSRNTSSLPVTIFAPLFLIDQLALLNHKQNQMVYHNEAASWQLYHKRKKNQTESMFPHSLTASLHLLITALPKGDISVQCCWGHSKQMASHSSLLFWDLGNCVSLPYLQVTTRLFVFPFLTQACIKVAPQKIISLNLQKAVIYLLHDYLLPKNLIKA